MDKQVWDSLASNFLQSWAWGELQKAEGVKFWRLQFGGGVALVIKREMRFGKGWMYVPGFAILTLSPRASHEVLPLRKGEKVGWDVMQDKIIELGKAEKAVFIRVDSQVESFDFGKGWRKAKREVQPKETLVIDLCKTEEELLGEMHQKTRYNIRLAIKKGVSVRFSKDKKDLAKFLKLAKDVEGRSEFNYHSPTHFEKMLEVLGSAGMLELAVAEFEDQILAVHILVNFNGTVTYLHGASSNEKRELMGPHLLQWESMRRAKENGAKFYDFWGVGQQWPGITRFKEGFGGERKKYVGAHDYVIDKFWYWLYNVWHR